MFSTIPSLIAKSFPSTPALWTPADITTLGWWDGSDSATVTLSGSNVTQWSDKSGNSYNGTQSTGALQPTYGTNTLNSLNLVTFDGSDRLVLPTVAFNSSRNVSIYSVGRITSGGTYSVAIVATRAANDSVSLLYRVPTKWGTYTNADTTANTTLTTSTYYLFSLVGDSGGNVGFWLNGSADGTKTGWTNSTVFTSGAIGNDQYGSSLTGDIGEIVLIDSSATTTERQKMEGYLAWKWGLEGDLPAGHPYKSAPPYV